MTAGIGALLLAACAAGIPGIHGAPGAPPTQAELWEGPVPAAVTSPASVNATTASDASAAAVVSPDELQTLTMERVIDIALAANPATRASWAQARIAAAQYGVARAELFPALNAGVDVTRSRSLSGSGNAGNSGGSGSSGNGVERTQYGPTVGLTWLLFDFGGRSGAMESARELAVAANLSHNAVVQNTVFDVEAAIFSYMATRALRDAQVTALKEAETTVTAAEERRRVGLATIADVLQARTARASAQLQLETLEGRLNISRGGVAISMGLSANTPLDIPQVDLPDSIPMLAANVDSLIAVALRNRPDLAAARAQALAAVADVKSARSAQWPALTVGGNSAYLRNSPGARGATYNITFGIDLPLFNGFRNQYVLRATEDAAVLADARTQLARQQVAYDVFASYYDLQTATNHVATAAELLASATQSEEVALARYREGVGTVVDLLIAQTALANARAEDVQAHWQWRAALARLAHDAGTIGIDGSPTIPTTGTR
jgi:outer membrane protein TolC